MTTAPVSHSNPKGKEKEKEKERRRRRRGGGEGESEREREGEGEGESEKESERKRRKLKLSVVICRRNKDDHYLANCSNLEFKQLNFVVAFPKNKDWFYVMFQPNKCWTDEYVDVILYYLRKKSKQHSHSKYRYTTTNCFFKIYIDNAVPEYENKIVGTIKGFGIPVGLPWHLTYEVYVPINCNGEFHWVLAVVVLKERHIKVYDSMSSSRTNRKLCAEIQKLSTMLPKYLEHLIKKTEPTVPEFIVKEEPRRRKKGGKEETRQSTEEQDLVSLVGTSFKNSDLIYMLNVEDTSRKHNESLCLLWFVHNVILAKDLNNNISLKWVNLSQDIEAFNNYPWGHESFELTVKYLLKPLGQKTNNLFGFPLVFMAWAFEAIPHLTHQVNAEEEISSPRILRWLRLKTKLTKNIPDLYNLLMMQVKMELAGAKTIKRDRVVNEFVIFDGVDGHGIDAGAGAGAGAGQDQGDTSCRRCSGFLCEKCKKQDEDYIMYLQTLSQAVNEFKNKRGGQGHSIKECSASIYSTDQEEEKILYQGTTKFEEEDLWRITNGRRRGMLEFKHVNVYKRVTIAEKNKLVDLTRVKELRA
uniref:Ulp1 protease family, C-terminal catalytic domain containing protein n=1 Tax=Solanum tuberosum TaxID=4113 RepID=M0ZQ81_SOLTU